MKKFLVIVIINLLVMIILYSTVALATNIYGDPPQFARPYKEWANTGFTATGALNNTNAVNEQTPDCSGLFCSYTAGGPGSSITFNLSAIQIPAIYDVETQSFNQTIWTTAILSGISTSKQLRGSVNLCSDGTILANIGITLTKLSYLTFFVRVGANLTNYLNDICVTYIPFLLAAGDTIRVAWVVFMVPPATVDSVVVVSFDPTVTAMIFLVIAFIVLLILGFYERFAMVGAALVCAIIAVLSWTWTGEIYIPAIFTFIMAVCVGMAITKKASN